MAILKRILKWFFRIILGLLVILLIYGSFKQWNYDSQVWEEYKPTGQFSDIGLNKVHFKYQGSGDINLILISGLGETMATWEPIEEELKQRGRVFMYDRSGLGHSEEGSLPRSVDNLANELHSVIENENIPGPYIIVGHSAGAFIGRYFAKKYPEKVMGLFLIDPYQEMGKEEMGEWPTSYKLMNWSLRNLPWTGLPYFMLPNPPHPTYKTTKAIKTFGEEAYSEDISLEQFAKLDSVGSDMPIYLLTADKPNNQYNELQKKWHKKILDKYSNDTNKHIIIESGHHIHFEHPEKVVEEIDNFLRDISPMHKH